MRLNEKARHVGALIGFLLVVAPLTADAADFAGTWTFSGTIASGDAVVTSAPVCVFRQSGDTVSGSCKGPNGIGSATGNLNGSALFFEWHIIPTNSRGLGGIATYHGVWGSDGVVRGTWSHSALPGIVGNFSGQRLAAAAAERPVTKPSAQSAAAAALIAHLRASGDTLVTKISGDGMTKHGEEFMQPSCFVVQVWAQCKVLEGPGEGIAWLHLISGKWVFVKMGGGVFTAADIERTAGVPASIAKQFAAIF
jgi:hypothetical protein